MDRLKISVKALMVTGPSCFRCLCEMPSGPTEEVDFVYSIVWFVLMGVKGGWCRFRGAVCVGLHISIFLSVGSCGSLEIDP